MSESGEVKLGQEMHEKILATKPVYQDEKLQAYVNDLGQKQVQTAIGQI